MGWDLYLFDVEKSDSTGNSYKSSIKVSKLIEKV